MAQNSPPKVAYAQPMAPGGDVGIIRLPDHFTAEPMDLTCNVCRSRIRTRTQESCNPICCVIFGCWALCCCQDVEHKCPNCNTVLGKYSAT